jgi:DNA-binding NtrC family response regulator
MRILVADDEKMKRMTLAHDLEAQGHEVVTAADGEEALEKLASQHFDVVVTDLKMPRVDGLELLKRIKRDHANGTEVIIMTAYGSIPVAVEATKLGAYDVLTKPFRNEDIFPMLARIASAKAPAGAPEPPPPATPAAPELPASALEQVVVGESSAIRRVRRMIEICGRSEANVLICGETGCGKDLIASAIHERSQRAACPLVKVGCTLFPSQLMESELYGHEKGAFTGAEQRRLGRFELAKGGTLYLDDVDDIPLEHQAKLLRAIEEKLFERVGGSALVRADVRIIASTKRNLLEKIAAGAFRQDLYYRLDVLRVNIPPLRDRRQDIPLLAEHLLRRIAPEMPPGLAPEAADLLQRHDWPGNVRELLHVLQRVYLVGAGAVTAELLRAELAEAAKKPPVQPGAFQATIAKTERELLQSALEAAGGNKTAAAAALGMKLSTFRDKLAKHGLL